MGGGEGKSRKHRSSPSSGEEEERERKKRRDKKEGRRSGRYGRGSDEEEEKRRRKKKHGDRGKDKERDSKERRSKEKEKSKRKDKDASSLKQDIKGISKDDYFAKNNEFATWLKEEKGKYFSDLSSEFARDIFLKFVKQWNKGKLPQQYYEGINTGPRSAHNWNIKKA